jgi:hypothetical protein
MYGCMYVYMYAGMYCTIVTLRTDPLSFASMCVNYYNKLQSQLHRWFASQLKLSQNQAWRMV